MTVQGLVKKQQHDRMSRWGQCAHKRCGCAGCKPPGIGVGGIEVRNFPQFSATLQFFTIFRNLSQCSTISELPFCLSTLRACWWPCLRCAEVLLLEALGGLVAAPRFPRNFSQFDLTLPDRNPPPSPAPAGSLF